MATTTTNFGWDIPQSTDLVKDGATAIAALGQDIDTAFVDLKGGTTGQILAKASNTDLDYTWVTNDVGDITAVTAGTGISGGGSSGDVTITNSMATAIDAKGDLIAGTGADAFSRLAAGNNGESLVADSSTSTGLRYQGNFSAGKNKIINGDFGVWQRGTGTFAANVYNADRWVSISDATVAATQQSFTAGTAPVAGYEGTFFLRTAKSAGGSYVIQEQRVEDVRTFAGQTVTLSFWAKADATVTTAPVIVQFFGSGGSASVDTSLTSAVLTTSWARYSMTVSVPSISGKTIGTGSYLGVRPVRALTASATTIDIWGVQLEAGSVATAFQTATGTIQGELAACQRYYFRTPAPSGSSDRITIFGTCTSTTECRVNIQMPVQMRVQPSAVDYANLRAYDGAGFPTVTSLSLGSSTPGIAEVTTVGTGYTAYRPTAIANNSNGYIGLTAEL